MKTKKELKSLLRRALMELARLEELCIESYESCWGDPEVNSNPDPTLGKEIRKALTEKI